MEGEWRGDGRGEIGGGGGGARRRRGSGGEGTYLYSLGVSREKDGVEIGEEEGGDGGRGQGGTYLFNSGVSKEKDGICMGRGRGHLIFNCLLQPEITVR